jgi:hypothetical protein
MKTLLEQLGAVVPMKPSPTTGLSIPALGKNDIGMKELLEHPHELVRTAAEVRLGEKSTILESRLKRMITVADHFDGLMPIPLRYCGADTTSRFSGTFLLNYQNMPRVNPKQPKTSDGLRRSLKAPAGYKVVVADLSGIEFRVNHFLWKVPSTMAAYAADPEADLYKPFAMKIYSLPLDQISKIMRQTGKVAQLGLGFGAAWKTFQGIARIMAGVDLSDDEARHIVALWRADYPEIVNGWRFCNDALQRIVIGDELPIDPWGMCTTCSEGIRLPTGMIRYPDLRRHQFLKGPRAGQWGWVYGPKHRPVPIYGGKVDENIVQALARNVMVDVILAFSRTSLGKRYRLALTVHDELVYVVRDADARAVLELLMELMATPPVWWPELITWSEGDIAQTYGDAK